MTSSEAMLYLDGSYGVVKVLRYERVITLKTNLKTIKFVKRNVFVNRVYGFNWCLL